MSAVDASRAGMASAVVNVLRRVGQVFGVAVLGALAYAHPARERGRRGARSRPRLAVRRGLHDALWVPRLALLARAALAALLLSNGARRAAG
jgi:MFS transporter, DHA2 family, methylenomycin A resistance protein